MLNAGVDVPNINSDLKIFQTSGEVGIFAADAPGCRALLSMVYEEFGCERAATPRKDDLYATF